MRDSDYTGPERRHRFLSLDDISGPRERDYLARELGDLGEQLKGLEKRMIDPREFGRLEAEVKSLQAQMGEVQKDLKELLELANRSRGGMWMGMAIASALGGVASWVAGHFVR